MKLILNFWRLIWVYLLLNVARDPKIYEDALQYPCDKPYQKRKLVGYCLLVHKPYRSVFFYRIGVGVFAKLLKKLLRIFFPCNDSIELGGEIAGGLYLPHNNGRTLYPHSAGKNLSVLQGVTIGQGRVNPETGLCKPVIGDNVTIYANAVVIGGITVGDNVTIGAGAVVLHDCPPDTVWAGNPARMIRTKEAQP